jgi:hypothetical protein
LLIAYPDNLSKALSIVELSASFGACTGPFISTGLNYLFGIDGPFIVFGKYKTHQAPLYLLIF